MGRAGMGMSFVGRGGGMRRVIGNYCDCVVEAPSDLCPLYISRADYITADFAIWPLSRKWWLQRDNTLGLSILVSTMMSDSECGRLSGF